MIPEQLGLTQYEWPMYHMKEKMLPFTDNNFFLFFLERFKIESRFPFLYIHVYIFCDMIDNLPFVVSKGHSPEELANVPYSPTRKVTRPNLGEVHVEL